LHVSDMTLYSIRSDILSQWSFLRTGVMWWCFGVLVTARARAFWIAVFGVLLLDEKVWR